MKFVSWIKQSLGLGLEHVHIEAREIAKSQGRTIEVARKVDDHVTVDRETAMTLRRWGVDVYQEEK